MLLEAKALGCTKASAVAAKAHSSIGRKAILISFCVCVWGGQTETEIDRDDVEADFMSDTVTHDTKILLKVSPRFDPLEI